MKSESKTHRRAHAFTLVELLVVIGIIALLIGILLPTLGRARQSADSVKCQANLRTIGQGLQLYVGVHKGMMPFGFLRGGTNVDIDGGPYNGAGADWTTLLLASISKQKASDYGQDRVTTGADAGVRQSFYCPSAFRDSTSRDYPTQYSAHPRLLPDLEGLDYYSASATVIPKMKTYRIAKIRQPAEKMVIFDATLVNASYQAYACAIGLDRVALSAKPFLTDVWSLSTIPKQPNQPVDLTPLTANQGIGNVANINKDGPDNVANIRFRHIADTRANALMLDGHVETFVYNKGKQTSTLLRKNIYVTPPR